PGDTLPRRRNGVGATGRFTSLWFMSNRAGSTSRLALSKASPISFSRHGHGDGCHVLASNRSPPILARQGQPSPVFLAPQWTTGLSSPRRYEPVMSAMLTPVFLAPTRKFAYEYFLTARRGHCRPAWKCR